MPIFFPYELGAGVGFTGLRSRTTFFLQKKKTTHCICFELVDEIITRCFSVYFFSQVVRRRPRKKKSE